MIHILLMSEREMVSVAKDSKDNKIVAKELQPRN